MGVPGTKGKGGGKGKGAKGKDVKRQSNHQARRRSGPPAATRLPAPARAAGGADGVR